MEQESWARDYGGGILKRNLGLEAPRRHSGGTQEAPRGTQEAPKRHPGGTLSQPEGTQKAPRRHQKAPRRHPETPGGSQGTTEVLETSCTKTICFTDANKQVTATYT